MKSFIKYVKENENPLSLGRLVRIQSGDENILVLVVRSENPKGAVLLVLSPEHPDAGTLINSKNLIDAKFDVINKNRIPITNYFFQSNNLAPIKRIEYHDKEKLKESIDEDVERSAFIYFQQKYRAIKNKDDISKKLNLIIEMMLTDFDDTRLRFY